MFGDEGQADTCIVVLGHPGPCAAYGIPDSVKRRDAWETDNPGWEDNIGTNDVLL